MSGWSEKGEGIAIMTERTFRVFLGAGLFLLLYISAMTGRTDLIFFYIGLLVFEIII